MRDHVRGLNIQLFAFFDRFLQIFIDLFPKTLLHHCVIKYVYTKTLCYTNWFSAHYNTFILAGLCNI